MSDAISRASEVLRARLTEIESERTQLERALTQLQTPGASAARRRRTSRSAGSNSNRSKATRAPTRRRIAPRGQRREQLLQYLGKRPSARPKEIAEALGISSANAQNVLRQAKQAGAVVKRDGGYALAGKKATSKANAAQRRARSRGSSARPA